MKEIVNDCAKGLSVIVVYLIIEVIADKKIERDLEVTVEKKPYKNNAFWDA